MSTPQADGAAAPGSPAVRDFAPLNRGKAVALGEAPASRAALHAAARTFTQVYRVCRHVPGVAVVGATGVRDFMLVCDPLHGEHLHFYVTRKAGDLAQLYNYVKARTVVDKAGDVLKHTLIAVGQTIACEHPILEDQQGHHMVFVAHWQSR